MLNSSQSVTLLTHCWGAFAFSLVLLIVLWQPKEPAASVLHNKTIARCWWLSSSFMSVTDQSKSHPALVRRCKESVRSMMERSQFWLFLFGGGMESQRVWMLDHLVVCQLHVIKYREGDVLWWLTEWIQTCYSLICGENKLWSLSNYKTSGGLSSRIRRDRLMERKT